MGRIAKLRLLQETTPVQLALMPPPGVVSGSVIPTGYPAIYETWPDFWRVLRSIPRGGYLGIDFEYGKTGYPYLIGIASETEAVSLKPVPAELQAMDGYAKAHDLIYVAHSYNADKPVLERVLGYKNELSRWEDSLIWHWYAHGNLAKAPDKSEDTSEAGSLGLQDLWSAASLVVDIPNWKTCRGSACEGPCPDHWKAGYNAVDAWTGLKIAQAHKTRLLAEGFPLETFQRRMALAEMCYMREREGIKIDVPRMAEVIRTGDEARNALFPPDEEGNYTPFNPRSAEQVVSWARVNSVSLADNTKDGVLKALERTAARYGFDLDGLEKVDNLPPILDILSNLHQFKSGGKSPEAWFGPKYRDLEDFIHPRFVHTGTSMGRLSSSRPNATNIPSRGFAVRKINGQKVNTVKACIIPSSPELEIVEADSGQLELRTVLWCAGVDVAKEIKTDAFVWLCDRANGAFDKAAAQLSQSPRDFAKRISHAASYLEGIKGLTDTELSLASTQHAISIGALRVYCKAADPRAPFDWYYRGGWVAFTGANLAEAMFGNKTNASRKLALDILEDIYFANFPIIRRWQKTVTDEIEAKHRVTLATGQFLDLDGTPEEDAKMGAAYYGQGTGAIYAQGTLRRMYEITNRLFLLQVHDSQVYETPRVWTDRQIKEFFVPMFEEIPELPGFRAPGKVNRGPSYGELRQIWDSSKEPL